MHISTIKPHGSLPLDNTLLPGYNRPASEARIVDKELLKAAQQLARKHEDWALANAALREAYGK